RTVAAEVPSLPGPTGSELPEPSAPASATDTILPTRRPPPPEPMQQTASLPVDPDAGARPTIYWTSPRIAAPALPQPAEVPVAAIPEEQPAPMPAERDEGLPAALLPDRPRLAGTARIAEAPPVPLDDGARSATDAPGGEPSLPEEP